LLALDVTRDKLLTEQQADALLVHLRTRNQRANEREQTAARLDELIVSALLLSGLRSSEFCSLRLSDAALNDVDPMFLVRGPGARSRTVHLPRSLGGLVRRYRTNLRPNLLPAGADPDDPEQPLVFNERRRPYKRTGLYRRVVRILTQAGLGDRASVQLLRHTYGYLAYLRTGGNLLFVQRQLGHAHPRITAAYAKFVDESYADLAERIIPENWKATAASSKLELRHKPDFDCEID
jgi:integrase